MSVCQGCGTSLPPQQSGRKRKWCGNRCRKNTCYGGRCIDCGGPTAYNSKKPAVRCEACQHTYQRTVGFRLNLGDRLGGKNQKWSDEAILDAIRSIAVDGHANTADYQRAYDERPPGALPSLPTIINRFERWAIACEAAGLQTAGSRSGPYKTRLTREGALLSIEDCAADIGRVPAYGEYEEWARETGSPSGQIIRVRFGSWSNALRSYLSRDGRAA